MQENPKEADDHRVRVRRFNQNKKWTREEEERLLRLRKEGKTWQQVGLALNRSKMAVYTRSKWLQRRALLASWSEEERQAWRSEYREKWNRKGKEYRERRKAKQESSRGIPNF